MTPAELELLQHALGRDEYGRVRHRGDERNYFVTDKADLVALALVEQGFLTRGRPVGFLHKDDRVYTVTTPGRHAMLNASPVPPKLTRSQIRYREFLDSDTGLRFGEWLKTKKDERFWEGFGA